MNSPSDTVIRAADERAPRKQRSVMDRAFSAAQRWLSQAKGYYGYTEDMKEHIAYRCGWAAGYKAARKDMEIHNPQRCRDPKCPHAKGVPHHHG